MLLTAPSYPGGNHLLDVHQRISFTLLEHIQWVFTDIPSYAVSYLGLLWLTNKTTSHQTEGFLKMGYRVPLEKYCEWL